MTGVEVASAHMHAQYPGHGRHPGRVHAVCGIRCLRGYLVVINHYLVIHVFDSDAAM